MLTGIGMLFATSVLVPLLKDMAKPIVSAGVASATVAGIQARKRYAFVREEYQDFMAEVQYSREQSAVRGQTARKQSAREPRSGITTG
jgi:hypothetical protein